MKTYLRELIKKVNLSDELYKRKNEVRFKEMRW